MATWHCPVCGLVFSFHSELDWHIRESHCLRRTAGLAGQLEREAVLSWAGLRRLQEAEKGPAVSLLLWTTPAPVMTPNDADELHHLAANAAKTLANEVKGEALKHMQMRLTEAVLAAESSPTDHGLAVFVSQAETAVVPLPFAPRERAVVNHSFATRDLLDALQLFPMYRALVLRGPGFRLLEGRAGRISEVRDWQVPNPSLGRVRQSAWTTRQRRRAAFLAADRAVGERVAVLGRLPLVLVGRAHLVSEFMKHSPHAASVVGDVTAWGSMHSKDSLARLTAPVIQAWREDHAARYLKALVEADRCRTVVWGLPEVWEAVRSGKVERLWVERDYCVPAQLAEGGKRLVVVDRLEAPGVVPDGVGFTIERATLSGAHVEIVAHLGDDDDHRIAAQLKAPLGEAGQDPAQEGALANGVRGAAQQAVA